jgi:hypothetical protein
MICGRAFVKLQARTDLNHHKRILIKLIENANKGECYGPILHMNEEVLSIWGWCGICHLELVRNWIIPRGMMVSAKWAVKDGCLWVWILGKKDSGDVEVTRETLRSRFS